MFEKLCLSMLIGALFAVCWLGGGVLAGLNADAPFSGLYLAAGFIFAAFTSPFATDAMQERGTAYVGRQRITHFIASFLGAALIMISYAVGAWS